MITDLYFVRHAHSTYTSDELMRPLSEKGISDAHTVTEYLKAEKIDHVVSSPYQRAKETVKGVARSINKEIELISDLRERKLSESPVKDFDSAIAKVWRDSNFAWQGGESNNTAQKRGVQVTMGLLEKHAGKRIVIGTHGNLMVLIMNHFNENYNYDFWKSLDMPDIYRLSFWDKELKEVKRIWGRNEKMMQEL